MQFQKKEKRQTTVRFDSHHVRLRTGEVQRKTGSYMYRWTDKLGKRNTIYAATLEDLREQEEQILVDQHDGIKANIKNVTVNDVYELWCQLKRGIKDSTMKNYIYMYELFVKPTFGKKKLVQVKKSDVRRFYNQLIDDKVLKPSTVDVIHNIVQSVLGHADVTTTLDIYVTVTNDLKKREITAFETYLKTGAKQMANV